MLIHPENAVVFHDHSMDSACTPNCYEHTDFAPTYSHMYYFVRINGILREVHPLTKPHRGTGGTVLARTNDGKILRVHDDALIRYRED